jgi:ribosomal-protein-alanine acetyltransferase
VFHLQQFKAEDMFDVLKLASKVLSEQYNPTLFTYFYESCPWGFWTAHHYQQLVGFIVGVPFSEDFAKILMIGVKPTVRRKGIGSHLLKQLLNEFSNRNISTIELEVSVHNRPAITFYQNHHFTIIDEFSNFYQNGENAFIMQWTAASR